MVDYADRISGQWTLLQIMSKVVVRIFHTPHAYDHLGACINGEVWSTATF